MKSILTPHEERAAIAMGLAARGLEPHLSTAEAAVALGLREQTLRKWAALECGPIRPLRVGRRLAWKVSDVRALMSGETFGRAAQAEATA